MKKAKPRRVDGNDTSWEANSDAVRMLLDYFNCPPAPDPGDIKRRCRRVRFNVLAFDGEAIKDKRPSSKQQEEERHQRALARIRHAHEMKMKLKEKLT